MKFKETKKAKVMIDESQKNTKAWDNISEISTESEHLEDIFQVQLYNSGTKLLRKLETIEGTKETAYKSYEFLKEQLAQLKNFSFEIGFAGGMSSGKSTVINSLIEYPLMPTCKLTTTCVSTHIFYGEKPKLSVIDDDTGKRVLNVDCTNISQIHFQKLKEYACATTHFKIIENLQHFTDHNIFQDKDSLEPDMLEMDRSDPNQVIILLMILLTVYVDQNSLSKSNKAIIADKKRQEVLRLFNFPADTVNYTIQLQWNGDFLRSGMTITDLPGLGAYAPDKDIGKGRTLKGHDSISTDAIKKTDAMVFLVDPQVDGTGVPALQGMISNAQLKEVVNQSDLVIPVLNKVDDCRGKSEVDQAIDKFIDILKNTGVHKKAEDIHLYSAWYGEYKFTDFPDDRTCFFFRNYDAFREDIIEDHDENLSEEELHCAIMKKSKKRLANQYKKAGIEELKSFFRTAYIRKSKNHRSQAAVLAVRKLALEVIVPKKNLLDNLDVLYGITGNAINDISTGLRNSIEKPIGAAIEHNSSATHNNEIIQYVLARIPNSYVSAFQEALKDYKERNIAICNRFSLGWLGFSDKAQIDKLGSENQLNYVKLCNEMEVLGVDIKEVNEGYNSVLRHVAGETEAMYESALGSLANLKEEISKALDEYEKQYRNSIKEDDPVLTSVAVLKNTLLQYAGRQIDLIMDNMKANHSSLLEIGNNIVNKILSLNASIVSSYTKSVVAEVKRSLSTGGFFTKKEYITVTGSDGILKTFLDLNLSFKDSQYIKDEIQSISMLTIENELDNWYEHTKTVINNNFSELREQMIKIIDNTVSELQKNSEDVAGHRNHLKEVLEDARSAFIQLRRKVQKLYAASLSDDKDNVLSKYEKNIFCEIIDLTEEEQYEKSDS